MWKQRGFAPEQSIRLCLLAATLAMTGAAACGPSGGNSVTYTIVFRLSDSPDDLETLAFDVAYDGGSIVGNGTTAGCRLVADDNDETADFSDDDEGMLSVSIDATENPLVITDDIVECDFSASSQPSSENFTITVLSATDSDGAAVTPGDVDVVIGPTEPATGELRTEPAE